MFFLHIGVFFLFRPRVFSRALGSGHARSPPEHHSASVGPGRAPWYVLWGFEVASNHGEAFRPRGHSEHEEPSRPIQTEVQVYKNVRRVAHVVQNSADGTQWLPAHLALMLECSCSCSSAPRAHARVLVAVLSCLCWCSTARRRRVRVVLVLECSLFGVLTMMSHTGQAHVIQPPKSIVWTIPITRQSPHA